MGQCTIYIYINNNESAKMAVRIIVSANYRAPTSPIFKELNILNFEKVYINLVTLFMFKFDNCMLPEIFYKTHKAGIPALLYFLFFL